MLQRTFVTIYLLRNVDVVSTPHSSCLPIPTLPKYVALFIALDCVISLLLEI